MLILTMLSLLWKGVFVTWASQMSMYDSICFGLLALALCDVLCWKLGCLDSRKAA